jgi:hypothetical protein
MNGKFLEKFMGNVCLGRGGLVYTRKNKLNDRPEGYPEGNKRLSCP